MGSRRGSAPQSVRVCKRDAGWRGDCKIAREALEKLCPALEAPRFGVSPEGVGVSFSPFYFWTLLHSSKTARDGLGRRIRFPFAPSPLGVGRKLVPLTLGKGKGTHCEREDPAESREGVTRTRPTACVPQPAAPQHKEALAPKEARVEDVPRPRARNRPPAQPSPP